MYSACFSMKMTIARIAKHWLFGLSQIRRHLATDTKGHRHPEPTRPYHGMEQNVQSLLVTVLLNCRTPSPCLWGHLPLNITKVLESTFIGIVIHNTQTRTEEYSRNDLAICRLQCIRVKAVCVCICNVTPPVTHQNRALFMPSGSRRL